MKSQASSLNRELFNEKMERLCIIYKEMPSEQMMNEWYETFKSWKNEDFKNATEIMIRKEARMLPCNLFKHRPTHYAWGNI